jgi:hypothetical protein
MPYQAYPSWFSSFKEPKPETARLRRYMDLAQFLFILEKQTLFSPSVATLAKADPYEGEPLPAKLRAAQAQGAEALRTFRLNCEVFKHLNFYNCWHMNDGESDAMWKLYRKGSDGIAIQSTVERVKHSFHNSLADTVYMTLVEYIDYDCFTPPNTLFAPSDYMYKRLAFRHEQEVRLGTCRSDVRSEFLDAEGRIRAAPTNPSVTFRDILLHPEQEGVDVSVNVPVLIERVVIYPFAPSWFSNLVTSLCKRLGYDFGVVPSEMARPSPLSLA